MTTLHVPSGSTSVMAFGEDPMELTSETNRGNPAYYDIDIELDLGGKSPSGREDDYMIEDTNSADERVLRQDRDDLDDPMLVGEEPFEGQEDDILVDAEDTLDDDFAVVAEVIDEELFDIVDDAPQAVEATVSVTDVFTEEREVVDVDDNQENAGNASTFSNTFLEEQERHPPESGLLEYDQESDEVVKGEDAQIQQEDHTIGSPNPREPEQPRTERAISVPVLERPQDEGTHVHQAGNENTDDDRYESDTAAKLDTVESGSSHEEISYIHELDGYQAAAFRSPASANEPSQHPTSGFEGIGSYLDIAEDGTVINQEAPHEDEAVTNRGSPQQQPDPPQHERLHPVLVKYQDNEMALFPPHGGEEHSHTYFLSHEAVAHEGIDKLLHSCREILADSIDTAEELEITIPLLGLRVCECTMGSSIASLADLVDLYLHLHQNDGTDSPEPLRIALHTKGKFSSRLESLYSAAAAGKGIEHVSRSKNIHSGSTAITQRSMAVDDRDRLDLEPGPTHNPQDDGEAEILIKDDGQNSIVKIHDDLCDSNLQSYEGHADIDSHKDQITSQRETKRVNYEGLQTVENNPEQTNMLHKAHAAVPVNALQPAEDKDKEANRVDTHSPLQPEGTDSSDLDYPNDRLDPDTDQQDLANTSGFVSPPTVHGDGPEAAVGLDENDLYHADLGNSEHASLDDASPPISHGPQNLNWKDEGAQEQDGHALADELEVSEDAYALADEEITYDDEDGESEDYAGAEYPEDLESLHTDSTSSADHESLKRPRAIEYDEPLGMEGDPSESAMKRARSD